MKKILFLSLFMHTLLFSSEITIAVAANVSYAIQKLVATFETLHPETKVHTVLGSSGKLTAQIRYGAPYDLFMSADMKYPQSLYTDALAVKPAMIYAQGALALLSQKERDFSQNPMELLDDANIHRIAIANPKTAPYGIAAAEALVHTKQYKKLKSKFIYGESVSQTVMYAVRAADMGLVALSALYAPQMKKYVKNRQWVEIDKTLYTPIDQGMVILKHAEQTPEVKAFYDFMQSSASATILRDFGYRVP
jgi:molybdate transport system substrate-binding protein